MPPYLSTVRSFVDVSGVNDNAINTVEFLEAARGVAGIFDLMSSAALNPVKSDIVGNIAKVEVRYKEVPEQSKTLQDLVRNESAEKKTKATQGLLWLCRGLSFVCGALQATQDDEKKELSKAFRESYEKTLASYHSWIVKPIFSAAMSAVPYREAFFLKLREDPNGVQALSDKDLREALIPWLDSLRVIADQVLTFLHEGKYDKGL